MYEGPSRLLPFPRPSSSFGHSNDDPDQAMSTTSTEVIPPSSPTNSTTSNNNTNSETGTGTRARNNTDLESIEALAQNILEMQNLCSQVRMDAPLAVENQHIMELRVIRRHLELLQEQTRDLQSFIRATLNSLTGSLAALRSHVASAASISSGLGGSSNNTESSRRDSPSSDNIINLEEATPPTLARPVCSQF